MRKALALVVIPISLILALASSEPPAEDAGSSRRDGGSEGTDSGGGTDRGGGTDTGNTGTWNPELYGAPCGSDTDCPGGYCGVLYPGGADVCWKLCSAVGDCGDFPLAPGTGGGLLCDMLVEGGPLVCIMGAGPLGPCGNPVNSACISVEYGGLCGQDPSSGVGTCVQVCNPADITSTTACRVSNLPDGVCGCQNGDGCSTDMGFDTGIEGDPDGVCNPVSSVGDVCGFDQSTWYMNLCTGDQSCNFPDEQTPTGTCEVATEVDAGMPADAG